MVVKNNLKKKNPSKTASESWFNLESYDGELCGFKERESALLSHLRKAF